MSGGFQRAGIDIAAQSAEGDIGAYLLFSLSLSLIKRFLRHTAPALAGEVAVHARSDVLCLHRRLN